MKKTAIDFGPVGGVLYEPEDPTLDIEDPISWHHGRGGRHDGDGIGRQMAQGMQRNGKVFCFQNKNQEDWSKAEIISCSDFIKKFTNKKVDVVGYSQGGQAVATWLGFRPEHIATAGFIAGFINNENYAAFIHIPMRAWHDEDDNVVTIGRIRRFIDGVAAAGGDATAVFWPKDGQGGHGIVGKATDINDPDAYWKWRESRKKPVEPPQPNPKDPVTETYYEGGFIVFKTETGKLLKVKPDE